MLLKQVALGKLVDPKDVAYAALFFASEESAFITGVTLPVDGGYVA
jgi:NAD(P)-dependent dehydrogenase (short-subunit alcohol dehydrogenase family)